MTILVMIAFLFTATLQTHASSWRTVLDITLSPYAKSTHIIKASTPLTLYSPQRGYVPLEESKMVLRVDGSTVTINDKPVRPGQWALTSDTTKITVDTTECRSPVLLSISHTKITLKSRLNKKAHQPSLKHKTAAKKTIVRVLIDEIKQTNPQKTWTIACQQGCVIYDYHNPRATKKRVHIPLTISTQGKQLLVNDVACMAKKIVIIPQDGYAMINGVPYHGSFTIAQQDASIALINHVPLEEYVFSVLKTESWPGWPIEVNKVFAIASRSYVMSLIEQSHKYNPLYHVKNTNVHQTYQGMHTCSTIRAAVTQTKGLFLSYNDQPILAMFDSCCGGIIPAHVTDFDFSKAPYLQRTYPCNHCKHCWIYSWKKELKHDVIAQSLSHLIDKHHPIRDIRITKKDKAGLVQEVRIKQGKKEHVVHGKQFYRALKDIKSFCYSVKRSKDTFIFSGKGYGHHLGICQWGARQMVQDGWPYQRILSFYYPGTTLMKLT